VNVKPPSAARIINGGIAVKTAEINLLRKDPALHGMQATLIFN
jgi:hypothetical protein